MADAYRPPPGSSVYKPGKENPHKKDIG